MFVWESNEVRQMFSKDHSAYVWAMLKPASDYYNGPGAGLLVKRARDPSRGSDDCNVKGTAHQNCQE